MKCEHHSQDSISDPERGECWLCLRGENERLRIALQAWSEAASHDSLPMKNLAKERDDWKRRYALAVDWIANAPHHGNCSWFQTGGKCGCHLRSAEKFFEGDVLDYESSNRSLAERGKGEK